MKLHIAVVNAYTGADIANNKCKAHRNLSNALKPVARPRGGGVWGGLNPPLASRITPGIRTKPQINFFGKGVGVPHYLASAYLKS
jgi:hypothetical protein